MAKTWEGTEGELCNLVLISTISMGSGLDVGRDKNYKQGQENILRLQSYYSPLGPQNETILLQVTRERRAVEPTLFLWVVVK